MEKEKIYEKLCCLFNYNKDEKKLLYVSDKKISSVYKDLLFRFCFLVENGPIQFETLDELWLLKEFKNQLEIKIILDIIGSLISRINDGKYNLVASSVNSIQTLLSIKDYETLEIFRYLQSIYSSYSDNPSNIIFPLVYTIAFNKSFIKKNLKKDFIEIVLFPLTKLNFDDYIDYEQINKKFLKYFNGLLHSKEMKKECYKYLCDFSKNYSNNAELEFIESFQYFSGLNSIINECEKNFIKNNTIKNEDYYDNEYHNKNSISDTTDKTDNNNHNSPKKIGINNEIKAKEKLNGTIDEPKIKDQKKSKTENSQKEIKKEDKSENELPQKVNNGQKENESKNEQKHNNKEVQKENESKEKQKEITTIEYQKESHSDFNLMIDVLYLNQLCTNISILLNTLNINKESIEKYYNLVISNLDNKLLLNKLSSTILLLQNANIINIKRKLVECLIFEIYEKYRDNFEFDKYYHPSKYNLEELYKIIENILKNNKETEKTKVNADYERLKKIKNDNIQQQTDSNINIIINSTKTFNKLKMVLDFLRFCKKNLHPFVHAEGDSIDYYLLTNNLFDSDLKRADLLFSLGDMIETKNFNDKDIKYKLDELELSEDWQIYVTDKTIGVKEALKILLNPKSFSINDKQYSNNLNDVKNKLRKDLDKFNDYYKVFLQNTSIGFSKDELVITEQIKDEEKDLILLLIQYEQNLLSIFKNEIERERALEIINSIVQTYTNEVSTAQRYIRNLKNSKFDYNQVERTINSKINRIHLIVDFLEKQSKKFTNYQIQIYEEYENSAKIILKKSENLKEIIEARTFIEKEKLFEKWLKTKPAFDEQFLNENTLKNNFIDLINSVKLNISYTFGEKFVLWMIKNNFSQYLRN